MTTIEKMPKRIWADDESTYRSDGQWRDDYGDGAIEYVRADYVNDLLRHAKDVMGLLQEHGPTIVPHLLDSDQNAGQRLRDAIENMESP